MASGSIDLVLIDGVPLDEATGDRGFSVFDDGLLRGDGCFEAIRSYRGHPFGFDDHYRRLSASANALGIGVPSAADLKGWVARAAASGGDCIVRVILTRGGTMPGHNLPSRCIVLSHPLPPVPIDLSLAPIPAPWHPGGRSWELAGVKTISYAPNQAAGRLARASGFDDALLLSDDGTMLEGPTFSFAWVVDDVLETPALDLGILDSITRRLMIAKAPGLGISVVEGRFHFERLRHATEAMAISTVKQAAAVARVGEWTFLSGPVTTALDGALSALAQATLAQATGPQATTGR
jgi:branched-subunit amino acid aminotransferase/4-amino-4-deoxychorismate lyase